MADWQPQPERGPEERPRGGKVAGVLVCHLHSLTLHGLRTAHGSVESHARRVAQVAASCQACQEAQQ